MENQTPNQAAPAPPAPQSMPAKPGAPAVAAKDQAKSNKRLLIGCLSAFGCSIVLFVGALFAFLAFGSNSNPIFAFFGVPAGDVVNVLLSLINIVFLVLVFVTFILVVIGIFKITTARKDDKVAKRSGLMFTFGSLALLVLFIFSWIFGYFFLASKRTVTLKAAIVSEPDATINLTAPIKIKFDATNAPINKKQYDILSYAWDFGDGTKLSGNPQSHTFTELGSFKVQLAITEKDKTTGKQDVVNFSKDVTIQNVQATVTISADATKGPAPLTVHFDGSKSKSDNGEITAYAWDLDGDGQYDNGSDATAQKTFDKIGTYTVGLRVQDSNGQFSTGEVQIEATVSDTPTAIINVQDHANGTDFDAGTSYVFSAAASTSPNGELEKYSWDFGDGATANTRTTNHTFKDAGEYDVKLTVTDSTKKKGSVSMHVVVKAPSEAPLVSIKTTPQAADGVISGQAPFAVVFDATDSKDPNNNIVDYAWDFDGDLKTDDTNAQTSHTFRSAGTYNVSLKVTDATNLSGKAQVVIKVDPAGLKADIVATPAFGTVPLTVKFDASGSSYPDGHIVSYEWDFGDGSAPRTDTAKVSYQYTAVGDFTAKVTALTSDGKRATAQIPVNVRPVSLTSCFDASTTDGYAPLAVDFDPTCSQGTVVKYRWNFANLGTSTDRKPSFTFKDPGEYNVSLEVADAQNVVDTFTLKITVNFPGL